MEDKVKSKYFIGKHAKTGDWASVYSYKPQNDQLKNKRGQVYATIALKSSPKFAVDTAGNMLLDFLHETYFENPHTKILDALEDTLLKTSRHLKKLMMHDEEAKEGIEMDLTIMVIVKNLAYFVNTGSGHIFMLRDGNLSHISAYLQDPIGNGEYTVGSLELVNGDVIIVGTPILNEELNLDQLLDLAVSFSDKSLKTRKYEQEEKLALFVIAYNLDVAEAKQETELSQTVKAEVSEKLEQITNPGTLQQQVTSEKLTQPEMDELFDAEELPLEEHVVEDKRDDLQQQVTEQKNPLTTLPKISLKQKLSPLSTKLNASFTNLKLKLKQRQKNRPSRALPADQAEQKTYQVLLNKVKAFFNQVFKSIKDTVWGQWLGMGVSGDVYVSSSRSKKRNLRFMVVLIVVIAGLLYLSIKGIIGANEQRKQFREAETSFNQAESIIKEVSDLAPAKAKASSSDPEKIELITKLDQAAGLLSAAKQVTDFKAQSDEQLLKISSLRDLLNKIIGVDNPGLVIDFGSDFPGAEASDMTISNNALYVLDKALGKLYSVSFSGNNPSVVTDALTKPKSMSVDNNGNILVIDESGDQRLATVNVADGKITRHVGSSEFRVGNISAIEFADIFGGRIYGIDQALKKVVVFNKSGDTYGIPYERFGLEALATASDLHIADLKIYVLADFKQGLYRFYNEGDDTPLIRGLQAKETLNDSSAIFVDDEHMYVAMPLTRKILVFTKGVEEISLKAQYEYRGSDQTAFTSIKEIVADRASGNLFVLDGSKVWKLSLSGLSSF